MRRALIAALLAASCSRPDAGADAATAPRAPGPAPRRADRAWPRELESRLEAIDRERPGELGVFVERIDGGGRVAYRARRPWYLSSTVKVPIAIVLLRKVEKGEVSLSQEVQLTEDDAVDGAGELQRLPPGTRFRLEELLERMLVQSDSTAADMLVRVVTEEDLNDFLRAHGFGRATTFRQVRHDAYSELHPQARRLTNRDFIELRAVDAARRHEAFAAKVGVEPSELRARGVAEAFERYYARGLNSAPLDAFGRLLERLAEGELLSPDHSELLLGHMRRMTTGERRLKAGLPAVPFAQKTGTQIERMCNVGIVRPGEPDALVVAACVEGFGDQGDGEATLRDVGRAIAESGALRAGGP